MPIRFPTEAANADVLGEDPAAAKAQPERPPRTFGNDGVARGRAGMTPERKNGGVDPRDAESRPGKDINQAGFIKDKDKD